MMMIQRQATHVELIGHDVSLFVVQVLFDSLMDLQVSTENYWVERRGGQA